MTDNNAQPGYSDQLLHPVNPEGPIPEDIMEWIRANPDALYVSIPGKYIGREPSYWAGAMRMYRQLQPHAHEQSPASEEVPEKMKQWIMDYSREEYQIVYDDDAHVMSVERDRHIVRAAMKAMYRHLAPILHSLEQSIIQRDHNWKRIYDQLQEREKEVADLKKIVAALEFSKAILAQYPHTT